MTRFSPRRAKHIHTLIPKGIQPAVCFAILIATQSLETACTNYGHGGDSHRIPFSEVDSVVLAAARGDAKAVMRLYKYHEFYTHDHPQAVRWLRVAAKTGDVEAALHLGLLLVEDEAPVEGLYWLQFASARGDEQAKAVLWRLGQEPGSRSFGSPPK